MLLWFEEALVEIAMILATTLGVVMFVAAVWYHACQYLEGRARRRRRVGAQSASRRPVTAQITDHPSGHSA